MKMSVSMLGVAMGMAAMGLAAPEKPAMEVVPPGVVENGVVEKDRGLYVFPMGEDPRLQKLMEKMLEESARAQEELEAPVEFPQLDSPELKRLFEESMKPDDAPTVRIEKRWTIGVVLDPGSGDQIVVRNVIEGSPAAEAGVEGGDVLLDLNGIRLRDMEMLVDLLQAVRDQELELGVRRGEKNLKLKITAREMELPRPGMPGRKPAEIEVTPLPADRGDEVLDELRGMRRLMQEMLQELKKPAPPKPRVRQVPMPPRN